MPTCKLVKVAALCCCLVAAAPPAWGKTVLDPVGIYGSLQHARDCMRLARRTARDYLNFGDGSLPNCLRMSFHDAATYRTAEDVGGANGSIMRELEEGALPHFKPHDGLQICHALLKVAVPLMRATGCPQITYADTIQHFAATAVEMAQGPAVPLLMGRPDRINETDPVGHFSTECFDPEQQIDFWGHSGFNNSIKATVVLSGAHSIGNVRAAKMKNCTQAKNSGLGPFTSNPYKFDNHYFLETINYHQMPGNYPNNHLLFSDISQTFYGTRTFMLMYQYAQNNTLFFQDWATEFQELSMLGVSPTQAGYTIHDGFCDGCGEPETVAWPHPSFAAPPELPLFFPPDVPASAITGTVKTMTTTGPNPHLTHVNGASVSAAGAPAPMVDAASTATAAAPAPAMGMTAPLGSTAAGAPATAPSAGPVMAAEGDATPAAEAPAAAPAAATGADAARDGSVSTASLP